MSGLAFYLYPNPAILSHTAITTIEVYWKLYYNSIKAALPVQKISMARIVYPMVFGYLLHMRAFTPWLAPSILKKIMHFTTNYKWVSNQQWPQPPSDCQFQKIIFFFHFFLQRCKYLHQISPDSVWTEATILSLIQGIKIQMGFISFYLLKTEEWCCVRLHWLCCDFKLPLIFSLCVCLQ